LLHIRTRNAVCDSANNACKSKVCDTYTRTCGGVYACQRGAERRGQSADQNQKRLKRQERTRRERTALAQEKNTKMGANAWTMCRVRVCSLYYICTLAARTRGVHLSTLAARSGERTLTALGWARYQPFSTGLLGARKKHKDGRKRVDDVSRPRLQLSS